MKFFWIIIIMIMLQVSCGNKTNNQPQLQMTADEIVDALINMYSANATININDVGYRDSTSNVYFEQISKISGKSVDIIKSDFEKLQLMPDSLLVLQNRALDSLRVFQERQVFRQLQ